MHSQRQLLIQKINELLEPVREIRIADQHRGLYREKLEKIDQLIKKCIAEIDKRIAILNQTAKTVRCRSRM